MSKVLSKIDSPYCSHSKVRFCQGDVLKGLKFEGYLTLDYAIILTQDCDLEQDYTAVERISEGTLDNQDKCLGSILICPGYILGPFLSGEHIEGKKMLSINTKTLDRIKKNDSEKRYHYLCENVDLKIPEMVIDFKTFFTVPRDVLYDNYNGLYLASINELFREHLSQRFANFLSRIGLPEF